jgi:hypothetical protein
MSSANTLIPSALRAKLCEIVREQANLAAHGREDHIVTLASSMMLLADAIDSLDGREVSYSTGMPVVKVATASVYGTVNYESEFNVCSHPHNPWFWLCASQIECIKIREYRLTSHSMFIDREGILHLKFRPFNWLPALGE